MKKYFMFVAVAAAGMLASCSSESLTAGSDPKIEPTQEERVPIKINVATPQLAAKGATRGMGTVGDEAGAGNVWQGEKVNVFMFKQNSLDLALEDPEDENSALYKNVELTTPAGENSEVAVELNGAGDRIIYKYYPISGNFDFWGYFIDDANLIRTLYADVDEYNTAKGTSLTADEFAALSVEEKTKSIDPSTVNYGTNEITVPFIIDGSQDLMVAKAKLTGTQTTTMGALPAADQTRYYSAFSARRNVQPDMTFKHLLTRLTFSVYGADNETCGLINAGALPADGEIYPGVFVKSIKVKSKTTGNIIAAYTSSSTYVPTEGTVDKLISFDTSVGESGYDMLYLKSKRNPVASTNKVDPLYPADFNWTSQADIKAKLEIDADNSGNNTYWKNILRPETTDDENPTKIGGALLVSSEDSYDLEIELGQCLKVEEDYPIVVPPAIPTNDPSYEVKYATFKKTITPTPVGPTPETETTQGVSYNVNIKLFGFERIEITTTLEEWKTGTEITFDAE